jgi:molybdopterin-containing oxidoreductase family iron-sulfur binding subunit
MEDRLAGLFVAHRGKARGKRELIDQLYDDGFWADLEAPLLPLAFRFHAGWTPPAWSGDAAAFPLELIAYRPLGYAEGSGANQPWLRHLRTRPGQRPFETPATVHPDDVPGIANHAEVTIASPHGTITTRVQHDPRMRRGAIAIPLGGGHTAFGRWAEGVGANPMQLIAPGPAPRSGANAICTTRVRVTSKGGA